MILNLFKKPFYTAVFSALITLTAPQLAAAQDSSAVDIIPASSLSADAAYSDVAASKTTHPPIRLTPDKSELIRLDNRAGTIIVGNPEHLSVLAESAETLVLVPRKAGATYVTILGQKGELVMARHVIVASPQKKYVRIRKPCPSGEKNCQATQMYYCPDMCHEISMAEGASDATTTTPDMDEMTQQGTSDSDSLDTEAQ